MKTFTYFFISIILLSACDDNSGVSPQLEGTWQLSEVLNDPGDGSGTFEPVESESVIQFNADLSFKASGNLCATSFIYRIETIGRYDKVRSVLFVDDCKLNGVQIEYPFKIENGALIVDFVCIERCAKKYQKR